MLIEVRLRRCVVVVRAVRMLREVVRHSSVGICSCSTVTAIPAVVGQMRCG